MNRWFLVFSLWFLVAGNAAAFDACSKNYKPIAQTYKTGVAFIVQKCGGLPNVIIGTMHSDDPKLLEMHKASLPIIKSSKSALFEIKFDADAMKKTLSAMYYPAQSGLTLKNVVGAELYQRFDSVAKHQDPAQERLKPWAAAVMLQYPQDVADGVALDMRLQNIAKEKGVNVVGLEKPLEQLNIFDSLPKEEQVTMLKDALDNLKPNGSIQLKMQIAYEAKNLNDLYGLVGETINLSSNKASAKELMKKMLYDRNIKMAERMNQYFEKGNAFVAIGALHLPSSEGVLSLLESKGYKIGVLY